MQIKDVFRIREGEFTLVLDDKIEYDFLNSVVEIKSLDNDLCYAEIVNIEIPFPNPQNLNVLSVRIIYNQNNALCRKSYLRYLDKNEGILIKGLIQANKNDNLLDLAKSFKNEGMTQKKMYKLFDSYREKFEDDEVKYDAILDTMDYIVGYCHPNYALYDTAYSEESRHTPYEVNTRHADDFRVEYEFIKKKMVPIFNSLFKG